MNYRLFIDLTFIKNNKKRISNLRFLIKTLIKNDQ
jgi:hypothetical protein